MPDFLMDDNLELRQFESEIIIHPPSNHPCVVEMRKNTVLLMPLFKDITG